MAETDQSEETTQPDVQQDEKLWAMLSHLLALLAGFLAPLIIWLVQKDKMPFVVRQAKESLNFQITIGIAFVISLVLMQVVIGCILVPALTIFDIVMIIIASMKSYRGEEYRYPVCLRLVK